MEFNEIVIERLNLIFKEYKFNILEQRSNYLKVQSENLIIIIAHDQFENSNSLWMGRNDDKIDKVEIDNKTLKLFFNSNLELSNVPVETFTSNLAFFFEYQAQALLMGDIKEIIKLEQFDLSRSGKYTQDLLQQQNLTAASKAWDNGKYREFIELIDKVDKDKLSSTYKLKYKIANQKVGR